VLGVKRGAAEPEWSANPQIALWGYAQAALDVGRTEPDFFISLGKALEKWGHMRSEQDGIRSVSVVRARVATKERA
jgi:hypothetical protein